MSGQPDPKPARRRRNAPRRVEDVEALREARLRPSACAACGRPGANVDHVLPRGNHGGDDVPENLILLCGSGTSRCHGAKHGSPYVDEDGRRWTTEDVERAIGEYLVARQPEAISYVIGKLGGARGTAWLEARYHIEAP